MKYTKKDALRLVIQAAKEYSKLLDGRNYLFIYRNRENNKIEYFETVFLPRNFQHLTGLEFIDRNGNLRKQAVYFYRKCLSNTITEEEIQFRKDGTTPLKLEALPKLIHFLHFSKMTVIYNGVRPKLAVERIAGTVNYCLGFIKDGDYYVPVSCLLEDIRKLGNYPSQILAILAKNAKAREKLYSSIRYVAKGIDFQQLPLSKELEQMIGREYLNKVHQAG